MAITTASGNRSALPTIERTLPQAELLHRAIVGKVGNGERISCPELTGKGDDGKPLQGAHEHAHILPVDLDGDGHLDHIIVHAAMGLGDTAQGAIRNLRRTWTKGGSGDMQLAFAGGGDLDCLRSLPAPLLMNVERILGSKSGSRIWNTVTPFVPPRFLKARGKNSLAGQVTAELESRGLPTPLNVQQLDWDESTLRLRHFIRVRHGKTPPPANMCFALKIEFDEPLRLEHPLAIGYASHYGLGLFGAVE